MKRKGSMLIGRVNDYVRPKSIVFVGEIETIN